MRRKSKIDDNQNEIVAGLRKLGFSVAITSATGNGFPDILVGDPWTKENILIEIKDGNKPPSAQKLTPDQEKFHAGWKGQIAVVNSFEAAVDLLMKNRAP